MTDSGSSLTTSGEQVGASRVAEAFRLMPFALVLSTGASVLVLALFRDRIPTGHLLAWFGAHLLVALARYALGRAYRRTSPPLCRSPWWGQAFVVLALAGGAVWGTAAVMLMPPPDDPLHSVVVVGSVGIATISVFSLGPLWQAAAAFVVPIMLPTAVMLFLANDRYTTPVAVIVTAVLVANLISARRVSRRYGELQRLHAQLAETAELHEAARRAAVAANLAKSRFLANMSHEIRTPMNGILGLTELLLTREYGADERKRYLETIQGSSSQLLGILNDILDFSRIEAGELKVESIAFDPAALVRDVVGLLEPRAIEKGLALECRTDPALPARLVGDPTRVRQVLTNLAVNAIKFTERGAIVVRVAPEGPVDSPEEATLPIVIEVEDTGIGIDAEQQSRIFEAFVQADDSHARRFGGTGLGLSIVRQLVKLMGGEIELRSEIGRGSVFRVRLPLGVSAPESKEARVVPAATFAPRQRSARILLVEDNPVNLEVARAMLGSLGGFDVRVADNGREAVAMAADESFDAILMDCQMPEMDGLEASRLIRDAEATRVPVARIPIIAVTANAFQGDREACLEAGMDDFLAKPFTRSELALVLDRWLPAVDGIGAADGVRRSGAFDTATDQLAGLPARSGSLASSPAP